jgi:hypothetical protein
LYRHPGEQQIVKEVDAAPGSTCIVAIVMNGDGLTDLLSYDASTGKAVYSIAEPIIS